MGKINTWAKGQGNCGKLFLKNQAYNNSRGRSGYQDCGAAEIQLPMEFRRGRTIPNSLELQLVPSRLLSVLGTEL